MRGNKLLSKIILFPLVLMPLFAFGCGNNGFSLKAIDEETIKEAISNFIFDYEYAALVLL